MDETDNPNSSDTTNTEEEIHDDEESSDEFPENTEEKIAWLRNRMESLAALISAQSEEIASLMRHQLAEAPIPSPESITEMVQTVLQPEITAIQETLAELRASMDTTSQTPAISEPTETPHGDESPTELPVESPAENQEAEPAAPAPAPIEKPRRRIVKV